MYRRRERSSVASNCSVSSFLSVCSLITLTKNTQKCPWGFTITLPWKGHLSTKATATWNCSAKASLLSVTLMAVMSLLAEDFQKVPPAKKITNAGNGFPDYRCLLLSYP